MKTFEEMMIHSVLHVVCLKDCLFIYLMVNYDFH